MDQEIVDKKTELDTQINNLGLAGLTAPKLKEIHDLRSEVDSFEEQFQEAEQRRKDEFKSEMERRMARVERKIKEAQS